jgi:hypothetical protein
MPATTRDAPTSASRSSAGPASTTSASPTRGIEWSVFTTRRRPFFSRNFSGALYSSARAAVAARKRTARVAIARIRLSCQPDPRRVSAMTRLVVVSVTR